jgi:hypothetical protein
MRRRDQKESMTNIEDLFGEPPKEAETQKIFRFTLWDINKDSPRASPTN